LKVDTEHAQVLGECQAGVQPALTCCGVHGREKMLHPRATEDL